VQGGANSTRCGSSASDRERVRISLGLKQTKSDPWRDLDAKYQPGNARFTKVTNTTKYGAFIEIEEGVEGLLHISEFVEQRLKDPSEVMKAGDAVEVVLLKGRQGEQEDLPRVQAAPLEPVDELPRAAPRRLERRGVVKNVADFGVFVDVGENIDGLVHVSDLSWNTRVKNRPSCSRRGTTSGPRSQSTRAQKFSLGIKQLGETVGGGRERSGRATSSRGR